MERHKEPESPGYLRQVAGIFISGIRFVGRQLSTADLNPHEGRLRASAMPEHFMNIPDHPPKDLTP